MSDFEVRRNDDGTVDEIVANGMVHIEQMDDDHWWMAIYMNGEKHDINFYSNGASIHCRVETEQCAILTKEGE